MRFVRHFKHPVNEFLVSTYVRNPDDPEGEDFCEAVIDTGAASSYLEEPFARVILGVQPVSEIERDIWGLGEQGIQKIHMKLKITNIDLETIDPRFGSIVRPRFEVRLLPKVDGYRESQVPIRMILGMDFLAGIDIAYFVNSSRNTLILSDEHPPSPGFIADALSSD